MIEYRKLNTDNTRIPKERTLEIEDWHKTATLDDKEARSLRLVREVITKNIEDYGKDARIVVSCSFGVDSLLTLHLVDRVAREIGIKYDVVWNNTLNEYPQTRKYARELTEAWGLNLIEATPDTTLKKIYEEHGTDTLFKRKGDRSGKTPVVEKCCGALKHRPMKQAIRENRWTLMFNGVRAGESRQRWMSGRRDADFYYSTAEWRAWVCRPILWWTSRTDSFNYGNNRQEDVWGYVRKHALPYNPIYDLNAVIDDRYDGETIVPRESGGTSRARLQRLYAAHWLPSVPDTD